MGDGAQKLQRAAKSHVSSRAFGILLVLVSAWKSDHGCLLLEEGFGFSLGCMRAKLPLCWQTQQPGLLLQLFLTIHGAQSSSFGKGWLDWELKREEAVGARSTLACGLSSLWSLFPNCPSLQKDAVRWWSELYHPEPPSCGRAHCATGHPPTKDQCPPLNKSPPSFPELSSASVFIAAAPQDWKQGPLHVPISCISVLQASSLEVEDGNTNIKSILFQASLLSAHISLRIVFAAYGNLQTDPNTNQHPQLYYFPHFCFSEFTGPREISHAAYFWLCSCGLGHTGDISSSQLNSAGTCFLALRPTGTTWPCPMTGV